MRILKNTENISEYTRTIQSKGTSENMWEHQRTLRNCGEFKETLEQISRTSCRAREHQRERTVSREYMWGQVLSQNCAEKTNITTGPCEEYFKSWKLHIWATTKLRLPTGAETFWGFWVKLSPLMKLQFCIDLKLWMSIICWTLSSRDLLVVLNLSLNYIDL